jgi:hypothetical protein
MATLTQRNRFRQRIGDGAGVVWSDAEVDDLFAEAAETYPNGSDQLHLAFAVKTGVEVLMGDAAKRTSYTQNASSESASDIFRHLRDLQRLWAERVEQFESSSVSSVRWGGTQSSYRESEYPDA